MTNQIKQARALSETVLELKRMCNLPGYFMKSLASRPDVNFTLRMTVEGNKRYEFYIPMGTVFDTSLDYYGYQKLMTMFDYKELN